MSRLIPNATTSSPIIEVKKFTVQRPMEQWLYICWEKEFATNCTTTNTILHTNNPSKIAVSQKRCKIVEMTPGATEVGYSLIIQSYLDD